ncbi:hypothetical protein [Pseudoalteromonas sp. NBT06-2]|nr:hypothetical protein [Pseudoalteromonas sp. NBT06-2]
MLFTAGELHTTTVNDNVIEDRKKAGDWASDLLNDDWSSDAA